MHRVIGWRLIGAAIGLALAIIFGESTEEIFTMFFGIVFLILFISWGIRIFGGSAADVYEEPDTKPRQILETKECPFCAETIKAKAIVCRYC